MDYDLLTISELIAYNSASVAAILYVLDTLYMMCKNKLIDKKRRHRSSHWQYRKSIRRSLSLSCNSDDEQGNMFENLMTHPENVVMEAIEYENSLLDGNENEVF